MHLPKTKNGDPRAIPLEYGARVSLGSNGDALQGSRGFFSTALEEASISDYIWHCNRHTFASRLVMAGVDLRTVAELRGHRTLQMVMRYAHLAPEHQASAVDCLVNNGTEGTKSDTGTSQVNVAVHHNDRELINVTLRKERR
jgi:hypothetical protein